MAARSSSSGAAEGSMPSSRGMGSKMICFCSAALSGTTALRVKVPKSASGRDSGQWMVASSSVSPSSASWTTMRKALGQLVKKIIRRFGPGGCIVEVIVAGGGQGSVTAVATFPLLVGETHRGDAEVAFAGEAGRRGLGRLHEGERGGMRTEEGFERRTFEIGRVAGGEGAQELQELIAGVGGETVGGV